MRRFSALSVWQGMIRWMRYTTWTSDRMFVSYRQYYLQGDDFLSEYGDTDTVGRIFAGNSELFQPDCTGRVLDGSAERRSSW